MKKTFKKKPIIFVAILFTVILIGGTAAYYYSDVILPNQFQAMTYNVTIKEEDFDGTIGSKKVFIVNEEETNTPVVLRVSYNEYWEDTATGQVLNNYVYDSTSNGYVSAIVKNWTNAFINDFTLGSDGWYYYKKVLNPQGQVQILESISGTDYHEYAKYHLDFNFEAIQADVEAIDSIWGLHPTINGENVSWGF